MVVGECLARKYGAEASRGVGRHGPPPGLQRTSFGLCNEFDSLNSAVAWTLQRKPEIRDLISGSALEQGEGSPS